MREAVTITISNKQEYESGISGIIPGGVVLESFQNSGLQ